MIVEWSTLGRTPWCVDTEICLGRCNRILVDAYSDDYSQVGGNRVKFCLRKPGQKALFFYAIPVGGMLMSSSLSFYIADGNVVRATEWRFTKWRSPSEIYNTVANAIRVLKKHRLCRNRVVEEWIDTSTYLLPSGMCESLLKMCG